MTIARIYVDDLDGICECGIVDDLDHRGYCRTCAAAPHDRECCCPPCEAYWNDVAEMSAKAAARGSREVTG